jgi:CARDB
MLEPDKSCALKVVFTPGALYDRSARVVVDSDPPGRSAEAALAGIGRQPTKKIEVTPMVIDFDQHSAGTSVAKRATVNNLGEEPVTLGELEIAADDEASASAFAASNQPCPKLTLDPGGSCEIEVTFAPAAPNTVYGAILTVHSDLPGPAPTVRLIGSSPKDKVGVIKVTPGKLDLDNEHQPTGSVKVESVGDKAVTIGQVAATPSDRFAVRSDSDKCSRQSLEPNDSCLLTVTFTPPAVSAADPGTGESVSYEGMLEIPSDASPKPATVELNGTVVAAKRVLSVEPDKLDFVDQPAGIESRAQLVKVTSNGTKAVKIAATNRTGRDADAFTVRDDQCLEAPLEPRASCYLAVTFRPGTPSTHYAAAVEIIADAAGEKSVSLTGDSQRPLPDLMPTKAYELSLDPLSVAFTVANRGGAVAGPTTVKLELPGFDPVTRKLGTLRPSTSSKLSVSLPEACYNRCELTVTVDDGGRVEEADESNNQWTYLIDPDREQSAGRNQAR